jgi:hypothetical protein
MAPSAAAKLPVSKYSPLNTRSLKASQASNTAQLGSTEKDAQFKNPDQKPSMAQEMHGNSVGAFSGLCESTLTLSLTLVKNSKINALKRGEQSVFQFIGSFFMRGPGVCFAL